jgi:hypothetical protein
MFTLTASVASLLIWCQFNGIQLQPTRLENPSGWREVGRGGSITFVGQFVLTKGQSTDNGNLGVKLVDISWKPCPAHTLCLSTDAQATLRFYHPSDGSVICEPKLHASDTSYGAKYVCPGLPFTNLEVREINTRDGWALISFFNVNDAPQAKR